MQVMLLTIVCLCLTTKRVYFYIFLLPKFGQIDMSAYSLLKMSYSILLIVPFIYYLSYRVSSLGRLNGSIHGKTDCDPCYSTLFNYRWVYQ